MRQRKLHENDLLWQNDDRRQETNKNHFQAIRFFGRQSSTDFLVICDAQLKIKLVKLYQKPLKM